MRFWLYVSFIGIVIGAVENAHLRLALSDDFDDFNMSLWKHQITLRGGGGSEFEYYTNNRSNSYVTGGCLYIQPTKLAETIGEQNVRNGFTLDVWGSNPADLCTSNDASGCLKTSGTDKKYINPISSASLRTAESFSFAYGKVEVRAKLPRGDWLWPAIWMMPTDDQYGRWPASGEIDIMESRGNAPSYSPGGRNVLSSTLHWGPGRGEDAFRKTRQTMTTSDLSVDFHVYGLVWNETYIGTYLDNESTPVLSYVVNQSFWSFGEWRTPPWNNPWVTRGDNAPFDRRFYLILDLACGGTDGYFPDGIGNKPWSDSERLAVNSFYDNATQWYPTWTSPFAIDSVKVWTYG